MKKILRISGRVLDALLLLVGIAVIALLASGGRFYAIETDSMQNTYPAGTLVLTLPVTPSELETGDVVTFITSGDVIVTHRVVQNDFAQALLITKGDENDTVDASPVYYENVLGKAVCGISHLGNLGLLFRKSGARIAALCVLVGAALYLLIYGIFYIRQKRRRDS